MANAAAKAARRLGRRLRGRVVRGIGGAARTRVVVLFGSVLALSGADAATVGAVAPQLESSLHISNTEIGLLSSAALLVGAVFTIPVGFLVDRIDRVPILSLSIVLWSAASLMSAVAGSYGSLLVSRLLLGAVTATAGPAIASLTGDYFPARERGRIYSYILGGEIAGSAAGFIVSGSIAGLLGWRAAFALLALPGFYLARELYRTVPEPLRGGQSRLAPGVEALGQNGGTGDAPADAVEHDEVAHEAVKRRGIEPDPDRVLPDDGRSLGLVGAARYILQVPTNIVMIISSALGYFFFAGLSTFGLLFVRGHYHTSQAEAELVLALLVIGAMVGTLVSGWLGDRLVSRGMIESRIWIPAFSYLGAGVLLVPGLASSSLSGGIWFDVAGTALLSAANPPLDAARLDIMPSGLWGRAESTRTFLRSLAQGIAPLVFGGLADLIAGIAPKQAPIGTHPVISPGSARGLEITFLLMLGTLAAAGLFLLRARTTYPRDIATAAASNAVRSAR